MTDWHPLRSPQDGGSNVWQDLDKKAQERAQKAQSAKMPSLDHTSMKDFEQVYEPSDDTYLLIDGIKADIESNPKQKSARTILEIGSGSGVPITFLATLLSHPSLIIATDINPKALRLTKQTAIENGVTSLETIQCDLASPILSRLQNMVDIIIFNPPYVPTPDDEVSGNGIEASWAGGSKGRRVIDRAIPQIAKLLSKNGICYLITVDDNEPEDIANIFKTFSLTMVPLVRRRAFNEYLSVQKISINHNLKDER